VTLEEFASRIEESRTKPYKGMPGYTGRCPSCAANGSDKDCGHFIVWQSADEWLHCNCIKGCDEELILSALGMTQDDRRVKPYEAAVGEKQLPIYTYDKVTGGYCAEKLRKLRADGKKYCLWQVRFKDGVPLEKISKTVSSGPNKGKTFMAYPTPDDVGLNGELEVLYRFLDVRKAIDRGETIYIGEGEPASETARKHGYCHTCQPNGAGRGKWLPAYTAQLRGAKELVIIADRDPRQFKPDGSPEYNGEDYAIEVFIILRAAGFNVRVTRSKTLNPHDDFRDHLDAGFNPAELVVAPDLMPSRGLALRLTTADAPPVEVRHVLDPYFPRGATVLLDGHGGTKKTFMCVCLGASLSVGYDPISMETLERPLRTLFIHKGGTEDDPYGGDNTDEKLNTIFRINGGVGNLYTGDVERFDDAGLTLLEETITDNQIDLVIVDYLFLYLNGVVKNINDPLECLSTCQKLLRIAKRTDCCIVCLRHTSKGGANDGRDPSEMGSGSNQWHDAFRGHLIIRKHTAAEHRARGVVVLTDEKGDLLNPQGEAVIFSRRGDEMYWERTVENPFGGDGVKVADKGKKAMVENWLTDNLTGQFMTVLEVNSRLQAMGVSLPTIKRARSKLGVKAVKTAGDGGWMLTIEGEKPDPFAD
jgi:hypothetical protein